MPESPLNKNASNLCALSAPATASGRLRENLSLFVIEFDARERFVRGGDHIDGRLVRPLETDPDALVLTLFDPTDRAALEPLIESARRDGWATGSMTVTTSIGERRLNVTCLARTGGGVLLFQASSLKTAETRVRDLRDRLQAILDNAADAIMVIDAEGVIENANRAAERLTGWRADDLRGQPIARVMGPAHAQAHPGFIERYLRTGRSGILNIGPRPLPLRTRSGEYVPIELSVGETLIAGERKFIGVCRDISARIAVEEALRGANRRLNQQVDQLKALSADLTGRQDAMRALAADAEAARAAAEHANAAKSRFVATMSHELRTPLNGILAVAEALTKRPLAKRDRELAELIRSSGQGLLSILNEVLDLARIESGVVRLEPEAFDLPGLVNEVGEVWRVAAEAKGLHLEVAVDEALPVWVFGDPKRLRQVLSNLLNNAIKFTEHGRVRLSAAPLGPDRARFEILDSGPGIAADDRERLFEPFAQGDASMTRRHGGAGLGLAICRELSSLMGGEVRAEAGRTDGAMMILELNLPATQAPRTAPLDVRAENDDGIMIDPLILVAEDHPLNRKVIAIVLEQAGLRFRFAEDGQAALDAVAGGGFDIVLMDVHMPRLDGLEATRRIRGLADPALRTIPIVAVTANASAGEIEACLAAGMDAIVGKPLVAAELLGVIARLLDPSATRAQAT